MFFFLFLFFGGRSIIIRVKLKLRGGARVLCTKRFTRIPYGKKTLNVTM